MRCKLTTGTCRGGCTGCTRRTLSTVHSSTENNPQFLIDEHHGPHGSTDNVSASDVDGRVGGGLGRFDRDVWCLSGRSSKNVVPFLCSRAVGAIWSGGSRCEVRSKRFAKTRYKRTSRSSRASSVRQPPLLPTLLSPHSCSLHHEVLGCGTHGRGCHLFGQGCRPPLRPQRPQ